MLDEPLGSLDRTLRERLTEEVRQIIVAAGVTAVYVTHDQAEAFTVADRLVLMQAGTVAQAGSPQTIYQHPASPFVAQFLSLTNLLPVTAAGTANGTVWAETALGRLKLDPSTAIPAGPAVLLIRPEAAQAPIPASANIVTGQIERATFRGNVTRVRWQHTSGVKLDLDLPTQVAVGTECSVALQPASLSLIAADER